MDVQKALDVLKHGMSTEIWGLNFYNEAQNHTSDETGREVFKSLIDEEESHLNILRGEYTALSGAGAKYISREEALALAETVDPTTIFPSPAKTGEIIAAVATDLEVLGMALTFEEKGFKFYQNEADLADSPEAKALWSFLAKAENKHYTFIQQTYEYLVNNGVWFFDDNEKPIFEG